MAYGNWHELGLEFYTRLIINDTNLRNVIQLLHPSSVALYAFPHDNTLLLNRDYLESFVLNLSSECPVCLIYKGTKSSFGDKRIRTPGL
jgi:hypothetical protein